MDIRALLSDPQFRLGIGLLGAAGPMPANVGFGQRLSGALGSYDEWDRSEQKRKLLEEEQRQRREELDQQKAIRQMQIDELLAKKSREAELRDVLKSSYRSPVEQALAGGGGPTPQNAALIPQMKGGYDFDSMREELLRRGNLEGASTVQALIPKPDYEKIGEGETLFQVGRNGVKQVASGPKKDTRTPIERVAAQLFTEGSPEYMNFMRQWAEKQATHAPSPNASVYMPPAEKAEQAAQGAARVKNYWEGVVPEANAARTSNAQLQSQAMILDAGFKTGWGTPAMAEAANALSSIFNAPSLKKYAGDAAKFNAAMKDQVLAKQIAQKGPQTKEDAQRMEETLAGLRTPTEAAKFLIDFQRSLNDMAILRERFYDSWYRQNKTYEGAQSAWYNGPGGQSIFDAIPRMQRYRPTVTRVN